MQKNQELMLEENLKKLWCVLLNIEDQEIRMDTDFFEERGNSLLLSILIKKIEEMYQISLTIEECFKNSRFSDMKRCIREKLEYN